METSNISAETNEEQAPSRLDVVESKMSVLEMSVNKVVRTLMPKVDVLLTVINREEEPTVEVCTFSASTSSTSLFEMAERGEHEALISLVEDLDMDFQKNPHRNYYGDTALHLAAKGGHLRAVATILGLGANINCPGNRLRTPLHCAVAQGHMKVVRHLLIAEAKVDVNDAEGATPLTLAAEQGNRDCVKILLQHGAHPDEATYFKAAGNRYWQLVEWLLQNGGDLPLWGNKVKDPLIVVACKAKRWEIVKLLLEKGASAIKCRKDQDSALVWASMAGQDDVVRDLLRHGAASHVEQTGWALMNAKNAAVVWAFVDIVPFVTRGPSGAVGIVEAACHGRLEVLLAFLEAGVNVNTRDRHGISVLSRATRHGHIACVRVLLERGAEVNSKCKFGYTPLHEASINGDGEFVRALLEAGASISERSNGGQTPLDEAKTPEILQMLRGRR